MLPFMVSRLPMELRDRVKLLVLLGVGETVSFEFHMSDWVRGSSNSSDLSIYPEIVKLKGMKILCFCGTSEKNSLCRKLDETIAETVFIKGGHHFGGDYTFIVDQIIAKLK